MEDIINEIQSLLNVPSVDQNPKPAIDNMKILNLLNQLRGGEKEIISKFSDWFNNGVTENHNKISEEEIDAFLTEKLTTYYINMVG